VPAKFDITSPKHYQFQYCTQ